jgi:hypothetical protein
VTERNQAVRLARAEIATRTFGTTRQTLASHEVAINGEGEAVVARVDATSEPGAYFVYFPIHGQPYFCVVAVTPGTTGTLAVSGCYVEAGIRVYLGISSTELSPAEMTALVGVAPTMTHQRGDRRSSRGTLAHDEHFWQFEPQPRGPGTAEEKLAALMDAVAASGERIASLGQSCKVQLTIVYEGWGGCPQFGGIHLNADLLRRVASIGAALDLDLYSFGPPLLEDALEPHDG